MRRLATVAITTGTLITDLATTTTPTMADSKVTLAAASPACAEGVYANGTYSRNRTRVAVRASL